MNICPVPPFWWRNIAPWAAGFVNGVLRNFLRSKEELLARADSFEPARYAHPQWWIDRLRLDYPDAWEVLRTDIYLQGQGVRHPDEQSYTGHFWYQATVDLPAGQNAAGVRLMFPGLFNECWLYLNGELIAHRAYTEPWWRNDYKFEWDVDLAGKLKPGPNLIALRGVNPHHFGGMFRRPFLHRPSR